MTWFSNLGTSNKEHAHRVHCSRCPAYGRILRVRTVSQLNTICLQTVPQHVLDVRKK